MPRIPAGLVICLAAVVAGGCGTVPAPHSGSTVHAAAAGSSPDCQGPAPTGVTAGKTLVITLAGNAETYCARVGDTLHVDLRGTGSHPWLRPLITGNALVAMPSAGLAKGVTHASFAAVRPGRVTVTSVRPPCQAPVPTAKNEFEPAFPLPKVYPLRSCPPGHRFSALVIVR